MVPPSTPTKMTLSLSAENNTSKGGRSRGNSASEASSDDEHTSGYVRANLARASEIEEKLAAVSSAAVNGGASAEERASKLRFELCELLSDILLTDPNVATSHDVAGRLWKGCFYGRIGELRNRIGRERSRLKKATARGSGSAGSEEELRRMLAELEKSLKVFLGEAVVLYNYLVDKYQAMLIPPPSQSQTQLSQADGSSKKRGNHKRSNGKHSTPEMSQTSHSFPVGVLPTLHRLLIHLGDLHRYASSFNDAETTYLKASKLGPGKGNPYNQLAVVAQLRETQQPLTAVALFWYARALLATSEPFSTSRSNLARLFAVNRQWLEKNVAEGGDSTLALLASSPRDGGSGSSNKRAQQEQVRAMKSAASRNFLAKFVDLHWDFARGVKDGDAMPKNGDGQVAQNTVETAAGTTTSLLETFSTLLQVAAFGDALLCKTVCINAFAVWTAGEFAEEGSYRVLETTRSLAIAFMLGFGTELAKSVENALLKHVSGVGNGGGGKPSTLSVRLLLPLLLTVDFVSSLISTNPSWIEAVSDQKDGTPSVCPTLHRKYWESIASLVNNIEESHVLEKKKHNGNEPMKAPKEYESYDGYKPFAHFIQKELECVSSARGGDGFVPLDRAVANLELTTQTQTSQGSGSKSKNTIESSNAAETIQKLNYFVSIAERHVGDLGMLVCRDGKLQFREEEVADSQTTMPPCLADETMENVEEDTPVEVTGPEGKGESFERKEDSKNLVEYKVSGTGPKLLVPTSLLIQGGGSSSTPPPRSKQNEREDMMVDDMSPTLPVLLGRDAPAPPPIAGQHFLNPALLTESQVVASSLPPPEMRPTAPPSTSPNRDSHKLPLKPPPGFFPAASPAPLAADTLTDSRFGLGQASAASPQSRTPPPGFGNAFAGSSEASLSHEPAPSDPFAEVLRQQPSGGMSLLDQPPIPSSSNYAVASVATDLPASLRTANPFVLFDSTTSEMAGGGLGQRLTQGIGVPVVTGHSPPPIGRQSQLESPFLSTRLDDERGSALPGPLMESLGEQGSRGGGLGSDPFALNSLFQTGPPSTMNSSLLSFLPEEGLGQAASNWEFGRKDNSSQQPATSMTRNPFMAP